MPPSIDEIRSLLITKGLIESDGSKIKKDDLFKELLFSAFLAHIVQERIKKFWKEDYLDERSIPNKNKKIRPFFHLPFHFVGFNNRTIFISEKDFRDNVFHGEIIKGIINSYSDISLLRRASNLSEISDEAIKSNHSCTSEAEGFCSGCKSSFVDKLFENRQKFFTSLNVKSHIVLDLPIELISLFISEDDLIEEVEKNICPTCSRVILEHYLYCPYCSQKINPPGNNSGENREKMFNLLLSVYLGIRCCGFSYEANKPLYENSRENDVYIKKGINAFLIEGTTQIDLRREYVLEKGILLLTANALLLNQNNKLILWSLDKECDSTKNKGYIHSIDPHEQFIFIPSSLTEKILANNAISIKQKDLESLKSEFYLIIEKIFSVINNS